jgi:hypothetical protein
VRHEYAMQPSFSTISTPPICVLHEGSLCLASSVHFQLRWTLASSTVFALHSWAIEPRMNGLISHVKIVDTRGPSGIEAQREIIELGQVEVGYYIELVDSMLR